MAKDIETVARSEGIELVEELGEKALIVAKRGGMLVPFDRERIFNALARAFSDTETWEGLQPLTDEQEQLIERITEEVVKESTVQAFKNNARISVESIQDLVEIKLMDAGYRDVLRDYILYRDEHKALREDSPRKLKVLRRDGKSLVRFNPMKIASAIEKGFRDTLKIKEPSSEELIETMNALTCNVVNQVVVLSEAGNILDIELIQDEIERQMMLGGFFDVAKDFIIYRAERAKERKESGVLPKLEKVIETVKSKNLKETKKNRREFIVTKADGTLETLSEEEIRKPMIYACRGLEGLISLDELFEDSVKNFYEGVKSEEIDKCNLMAAKAKIEKDPAYSTVAARLLMDKIYREIVGVSADDVDLKEKHKGYFKTYISHGISVKRLALELLDFDLDYLASRMDLSRDDQFTYLGIQTLYDRYFIHENKRRLETPQIFWMRVAMGLSINEGEEKNERACEFYEIFSKFLFVSSTPTLFNSGTCHPQLSSCYLSTTLDDLKHIFHTIANDAQLSKWAGGIGNDWTNVRATGAPIKGTNGESQGIIPFLKVAGDTAVAVNQGGKRKGAMCAYLETWHLDIEDFLDLRKNTGDERRRTHDMNTANWVPDLFMKRVLAKEMWTLFSPDDTPDLHDLYGKAFEKRYFEYEKMTEAGEIKLFKKVDSVRLWRKMLSMLFETGHPWITFKDPSNIRSPQDHVGVVHSSNLCTEILLNTSEDETAVCNLGSVNLTKLMTKNGLNRELFASTVRIAIRMLDNVIDINFYPIPEARNANLRHRPVGVGMMGFQDALYIQGIPYASYDAIKFADESMEMLSYYAILSSSELAKERGTYSSYKNSKWDRGILPIDSLELLKEERGQEFVSLDQSMSLDWEPVRESIRRNGMRNSNTMAIAPTATIANITGVTQSIEPTYKHLFVKSNLSGEFTVLNVYLVERLKELGMWDSEMVDDLKYFDGSLNEIERVPDELKELFATAFEVEAEWIIDCAARRQKWLDMGQSLNLYLPDPSGKKLHEMYIHAWKQCLKTTYYLRSLGATQIEKSTTDVNRRGLQPRWMKNKSASSNIIVERKNSKKTIVCSLEEGCESCQ